MERLQITYYRPPLTAYQLAFMDTPARYTVIEAATKSGKTTACLVWLTEQALQGGPGQEFWWVAPVLEQSRMAFRRLQHMLPPELPCHFHKTELRIEFPHGPAVVFRTANSPDNLYGEDVHAVVVDEASRCEAEAWYAIRSTLTATGGKAKLIGNVKGRGNWLHQLGQKARQPENTRYAYFKITAWDAVAAGLLTPAEVYDAQENLPEEVFRELYLAEPADDGGNPFGQTHIEACTVAELSTEPALFFGIDFGKAQDYTVIIGLDTRGRVAYFERTRGADWANICHRVEAAIRGSPALADSTGVGDPLVEELRRALPQLRGFVFTSRSKQQLMEALAVALQQRELQLPSGPLTDELLSFRYELRPGGFVRYSAPPGLHDDCVCALALAYQCLRSQRDRLQFSWALN